MLVVQLHTRSHIDTIRWTHIHASDAILVVIKLDFWMNQLCVVEWRCASDAMCNLFVILLLLLLPFLNVAEKNEDMDLICSF